MTDIKPVRIDKFLWAVRLYKTRSLAAEACLIGRIAIKDLPVKPSRVIRTHEIITVKKPPVTYTYEIVSVVENRVSSRLVQDYLTDLTSEDEKLKLSIREAVIPGYRKRGTGRPTKKERRSIDTWKDRLINP